MSDQEKDGRAESIRQRLRNELRARGEDVALGLPRYAVERFLYRLGRSSHRERFVLKGATLFAIWGTAYRPTRDVDFTGYGSADPQDVIGAFREDLQHAGRCRPAGLRHRIDHGGADPRWLRVSTGFASRSERGSGSRTYRFRWTSDSATRLFPAPRRQEYRTILGDPPPRILAYPPESVVAEKMHAMVILGERNSRYKDFYDLYAMAGAFHFERSTLVRAVKATFERRTTQVAAALPAALAATFYSSEDRAAQWRAYVTRNDLADAPADFARVGERLTAFLQPVWADLGSQNVTAGDWPSGGPWR